MVAPGTNSTLGVTMNYPCRLPPVADPSLICNHDLVITTLWARVVIVNVSRQGCVCACMRASVRVLPVMCSSVLWICA